MRPRRLTALLALLAGLGTVAPAHALSVSGNRLVDASGATVRLLGADRDGTEYACSGSRKQHVKGYGFADSPDPGSVDSPALIAAMKTWDVNAVRVPLNEACWLGINHAVPAWTGAHYRAEVATYVGRLEAAGIFPILTLFTVDPGSLPIDRAADGFAQLPDASHAVTFWRSVARRFKADQRVLFDLYNEPNHTTWHCLLRGCRLAPTAYNSLPGYQAAGTQQLVDAIRAAGARNVVLLGGLDWSADLSKWLRYRPHDPTGNLVASFHTYEETPGCLTPDCWHGDVVAALAARVPVITAEIGDTDCNHDYIDAYMAWADAHGLSYLGWAWDSTPAYDCSKGPALISDYDGTPTDYGIGLRDHLRALAAAAAPAVRAATAAVTAPPAGYASASGPLGVRLLRPPATVACETAADGSSQAPVLWAGVDLTHADRRVQHVRVFFGVSGSRLGSGYTAVFRPHSGWQYVHHHPANSGASRCPGSYAVTYVIRHGRITGRPGAETKVTYRVAAA